MAELDPDLRELIATLAADPSRRKVTELPLDEARSEYRRICASRAAPDQPQCHVADRSIEGPGGTLPLRVYTPPEAAEPAPGLVFFHGGGWVQGDLDTHDAACRRLASVAGAVVVAVDYRRAPEHEFPAAALDAHAATASIGRHADSFGIDPARLAVGGDSAGGNLAAVAAMLARDEGQPLAFQLLIYPVTAGRTDTDSYRENATGYLLERTTMEWFLMQYAGSDADRDNPLFSPLRAPNLELLPPAIVVTAGFDPLRDDGRLYAAALRKSGVPVRHLEYDALTHGFLLMDGVSRGAMAAGRAIAEAARDAFAGAPIA